MKTLLLLEFGLAVIGAAIAAFGFPRGAWRARTTARTVRERVVAEWAGAAGTERALWIAVIAAALVLRLYHIRQPMRHDEAYTFLGYASLPLADALSVYRDPNNHLFHTLLVWLSTRLLGTSPPAIRLPAFIAGMLIVPAVYVLARRFADKSTSLLAMALAGVWPELVLYSTNARGHSLVTLAFLMLPVLGDDAIDHESRRHWVPLAIVLALGMYTAPTMLYPAGVAIPWIVTEAWRRHGAVAGRAVLRRVAISGALAVVLTVMLMLPVVVRNGVAAVLSNRQVAPLWGAPLVAALREFAVDVGASNALGIPLPALVTMVLLGIAGVVAPGTDRSRRITLAVIALLWSTLLVVAVRRPPPGRVLQFLAASRAYIALGARVGLVCVARVPEPRLAMNMATCAIALLLATHTARARTVFRAPESGTLVDAPRIADYLLANLRRGDRIVLETPSGPPLDYYLVRKGGRQAEQINADSGRGRVFVVVNPRHLQTLASVQRFHGEMPWKQLELTGAAVAFAPETVFVFRYVGGD